jgi:hypothetical protein
MAAEHDLEQKARRHYSAACTKHKTAMFSLWHGQSHVQASLKHLDELLSPCKVPPERWNPVLQPGEGATAPLPWHQ